ncbi:response regulator [Planctomycetes bacterium K23_9]|uniref:Transcriptional regulatory protein TdiR n=1 Tax=Stieleria marina TaxID=1930275 RepID=A0A517NUS6_9BACT|nr:Transcriptional regulatory protein TdiR [Planctomycetes bacterium K23_9]
MTKKRIAIVDDETIVRLSTRALLKSLREYEVEEFDSAETLLNSKSLDKLDCLIVDFRLRGLSGLQLLQELQKRNASIPTIVVSGYLSETQIKELVEAGAEATMAKPLNTRQFLAELDRITDSLSTE